MPRLKIRRNLPNVPYDTYRNMVRNHIDYFLMRALSGNEEDPFSLEEIRNALLEETGILKGSKSLKKYLMDIQKDRIGLAPLCQIGDDQYILNEYYYQYKKVKPPKPRSYEIKGTSGKPRGRRR